MTFHVRSHGEAGAPPVVFLHGVMTAAITYDALCRALACGGRRVVAIDQRGHGESDHADDYAWERWVEDIALVIDALQLGVVDLVGHSMGAHNAARFASLHANAVRRLVLVDGGFGETNSPDEPEYWSRVAQLFPPGGFASVADYVARALELFPRADPAIVTESARTLVRDDGGRWSWPLRADMRSVSELRTSPTADAERQLRRSVACPTLVAKAEFSELFAGDGFRDVAAEYADGRPVLLQGTGHMVMWEAVDNTVAVLDDFLA